jgi:hypothetical protein
VKTHETGKILAFLGWLALICAVTWAIYFQDSFFRNDTESIAEIRKKSGDVMYREEGLVSWRYVVDNQKFADGDWVATGPDAKSTIGFRSGQKIKLGPDTQVQIRSILQGDNDYSYMVTLSRGAVIAEVKKEQSVRSLAETKPKLFGFLGGQSNVSSMEKGGEKNSIGMVVRSGNRSFAVESGSQVGLMKDTEEQDLRRIGSVDLLQNHYKNSKNAAVEGLKPNFLPPAARLFPEKMGSIVVAKEAILSISDKVLPSTAFSDQKNVASQEGGLDKDPKGNSLLPEREGKISYADLAALSSSMFSADGVNNSDSFSAKRISSYATISNSLALRARKSKGDLPVLALKEKVDRMDAGNSRELASLSSGSIETSNRPQKYGQKKAKRPKTDGDRSHIKQALQTEKSKQERKAPPKIMSAKGYEYFLNIQDRSLSLSLFRSISSLRRDKIKVSIRAPRSQPQIGELVPVVELVGRHGGRIPLIEGRSSSDSEVVIPLELIISHGREKILGAFREYEVSARAGCAWIVRGQRIESFERVYSQIKIRALGNSPSEGITVGLDLLDWDRLAVVNSHGKKEIAPESAPIRISVQSERDLSKIMPFIQASNQVGMVKGGPRDDFGYFVVRNQAVIAEMGGPALSRKILEKVTKALGGDFVFRGQKRALHDAHDKDQKDIAFWIDSLLDQGKVLYVMKRAKLYPVSRDFVKTNNEVAKFIDSQAKAVFVEKVDVFGIR